MVRVEYLMNVRPSRLSRIAHLRFDLFDCTSTNRISPIEWYAYIDRRGESEKLPYKYKWKRTTTTTTKVKQTKTEANRKLKYCKMNVVYQPSHNQRPIRKKRLAAFVN